MNPVLMRKVSGFQLSISTGMAMETLFAPRQNVYDPDRTPPPRASLKDFDSVFVNIHTLLRNIINATDYQDVKQLRPDMLGEALVSEIEQIQSLCSNEGQNQIIPVFYDSSYSSFYRGKTTEYKLRVPETPKQIDWFAALHAGAQHALQSGQVAIAFAYQTGEIRPRFQGERALILSHKTPDLLSYRNFSNLELLESHTGKIKTMREWNTKYHPLGTEKFESMPWCKPLLCWLGDKYVLCPLSITIRKAILDLSKERRWNPLTSGAVVHTDCLNRIKNPEIVKVLRQIPLY